MPFPYLPRRWVFGEHDKPRLPSHLILTAQRRLQRLLVNHAAAQRGQQLLPAHNQLRPPGQRVRPGQPPLVLSPGLLLPADGRLHAQTQRLHPAAQQQVVVVEICSWANSSWDLLLTLIRRRSEK